MHNHYTYTLHAYLCESKPGRAYNSQKYEHKYLARDSLVEAKNVVDGGGVWS